MLKWSSSPASCGSSTIPLRRSEVADTILLTDTMLMNLFQILE